MHRRQHDKEMCSFDNHPQDRKPIHRYTLLRSRNHPHCLDKQDQWASWRRKDKMSIDLCILQGHHNLRQQLCTPCHCRMSVQDRRMTGHCKYWWMHSLRQPHILLPKREAEAMDRSWSCRDIESSRDNPVATVNRRCFQPWQNCQRDTLDSYPCSILRHHRFHSCQRERHDTLAN